MYDNNWDQYYHMTYLVRKQKALWDVSPEQAVASDQKIFDPHFDRALKVLDLGCGTGGQSEYLSAHYDEVLGVDVSANAVALAREQVEKSNVSFDALDITQALEAFDIARLGGPFNIYMRGVLHQIKEKDIPTFQDNLSKLLGESGTLYAVEVGDSIRDHFSQAKGGFSKLPTRLRQVFISNLPPKGLSLTNIPDYFPAERFDVLQCGEAKLNTNLQYADEAPIYIPAVYVLLKNKL